MTYPTEVKLRSFLEEYAKACQCNEHCHCNRVLTDLVSYLEQFGMTVSTENDFGKASTQIKTECN
ncbi:hypothetical protein [Cysteiniphilum marinum]|uniref:hypothetical protein n=1 Tax=Cysteiniphilum marinum TaxID=2774191 RepID=UPI00193AC23F|nr:hypothetical protein [Cysteiniphilum marinum]